MKPVYEEELVLRVEQHLELDYLTQRIGGDIDMSDGLIAWQTAGGLRAYARQHVRSMFQVLLDHPPLLAARMPVGPDGVSCPACGDFSRSWSCEEHPDIYRRMGAKVRRW